MRALILVSLVTWTLITSARGDEITDARKQYAQTRREAAKKLYDSYKKTIASLEAKGETEEAKRLRAEMETFVGQDKAALDSMAGFDLIPSINKLIADVDTANELGTELQRKDAIQNIINQFTRKLNNKPFVIEFRIEEIAAGDSRGVYDVHFKGSPTLAGIRAQEIRILASDKFKLTDKQAKRVLPGDRIILRGQLFGYLSSDPSRLNAPGDMIFSFAILPLGETYLINLQSVRWQLIHQANKAEEGQPTNANSDLPPE